MRVIDVWHGDLFALDVLPHIEFRPVADREHAHVLALVHASVVQVPQFGTLVLRVPLAEFVAEREHALLGAGLLFVAARAADGRVETEFLDGFQQRHRLCSIAAVGFLVQAHRAAFHGVLDRAHQQPLAEFGGAHVAEGDHFIEVVAGVDVQQRERELAGAEGFFRQPQQDDGILAAGEEQHRVGAFAGDFAQNVDGLRFQPVEMAARGQVREGASRRALGHGGVCSSGTHDQPAFERTRLPSGPTCRPHSFDSGCSHHQRPARTSSPATTGREHGAQPMER